MGWVPLFHRAQGFTKCFDEYANGVTSIQLNLALFIQRFQQWLLSQSSFTDAEEIIEMSLKSEEGTPRIMFYGLTVPVQFQRFVESIARYTQDVMLAYESLTPFILWVTFYSVQPKQKPMFNGLLLSLSGRYVPCCECYKGSSAVLDTVFD